MVAYGDFREKCFEAFLADDARWLKFSFFSSFQKNSISIWTLIKYVTLILTILTFNTYMGSNKSYSRHKISPSNSNVKCQQNNYLVEWFSFHRFLMILLQNENSYEHRLFKELSFVWQSVIVIESEKYLWLVVLPWSFDVFIQHLVQI